MLTTKNLLSFLSAGESQTVEFKSSFNEEALETIAAFSNAEGGILLIGIKDSGEVSGVQRGKKSVEDLSNRIQTATDPHIQPAIFVLTYQEKKIVVIQVASNVGVPVSVRGRFFKRVGCTNQRMSHEEIMQRLLAGRGLSWDAACEPKATLKDLDETQVEQFMQMIRKLGRRPMPEQVTTTACLEKLALIKNNQPTRAALLLFGKNPETYFPAAFVKLGRFRSPTLIVDDREIHGSLVQQLEEAMRWFRERLSTEFMITGKPEREVRWEYPLDALREAVSNLLCHRDYTSQTHSQIRLYDDRLEFWNAGVLPTSLTPEALFREHDSMPRNRKIAEAFFYRGFIERWGSGTLRIIEAFKAAGLPQPLFLSESGRFKLILHKARFGKHELSQLDLSERQAKAIAYLKAQGSISNSEYQQITNVSKSTATRELNDMVAKNILASTGASRGRGKVYHLKA